LSSSGCRNPSGPNSTVAVTIEPLRRMYRRMIGPLQKHSIASTPSAGATKRATGS